MIYLDANVIIRLIEGNRESRFGLETVLEPFRRRPRSLVTSMLSMLECKVRPLREGNQALLHLYELFFASSEVAVLELTKEVIDMATNLRAFGKLKTPDALHVATAVEARVDIFLTGDKELEGVSLPGIRMLIQ